jgi:glycosyltransferase involved in cell wall biosynthesis
MTILLIKNKIHNTAGSEKALIKVANILTDRGHSIHVLYTGNRDVKPFFPHRTGIRFHRLPGYPSKSSLYHLLKNGIKYAKLLKLIKPDLAISFLPYIKPYMAIVPILTGVRHVAAHRCVPSNYRNENRPMPGFIFRHSVLNLVLVDSFKVFFTKHVRKKTLTIPNPVEPVPETNRAQLECRESGGIIISVGRLEAQKNHELLIRSFALIAARYPEWEVRIWGRGSLEGELRSLISSLGLTDRIILAGITKDIPKELAGSHIFAFPSTYEGYANALLEAMAHGLPSAVIQDCTSNREIMEKSCGGLISANTPESYGGVLEQLMRHPGLRRQKGDQARLFTEALKPEIIGNLWEQTLLAALSKKSAG